jgi:WD40 repeat protein
METITSKKTTKVTSVASSSDGRQIISGSYDKTIQVWNAETGDLVAGPLQGHTDVVICIVCSTDKMHIVSSAQDKTI